MFLAGVLRMASRLTLPSCLHLKLRVTSEVSTGPHLDIVHVHEVSTVVQVLFQVTVLEQTDRFSPVLCPAGGSGSG